MSRGILAIVAALILLTGWSAANKSVAQTADPEVLKHYSLYYEDYKNKDYERALPNLRWILTNAPTAPKKTDINYSRAVTIYREVGVMQEDPAEQRVYLDSALVILDTAVNQLKELGVDANEYKWTLEKGKFLQANAEHLPELQSEVGRAYEEAYDLNPSEIDPYYINYVIGHYINESDKQGAIDFMEKVEADRGEEEAVVEILDKWRGAIFTGPGEKYDFLLTQYDKDPENPELIAELFELAIELDEREMLYELSDTMLGMEPDARTLRLIAKMKIEDGEVEEAYELLQQAMALPGADEYAAEMYYNMGIAQQEMGRLSKARTHYRQALDANSEFAEALVAIGDLYAQAISDCGSFEREDRAVYWLVTDYYNRAVNVKPELAASVRQKSSSYRGVYPDQEMLFFKNWNVGDRYSINYGCYTWIGETTTVKSP